MGYGNHVLESQSPRYCFSTEDYREATRDFYCIYDIIEEIIILERFYCDECEKNIEFVDNSRSVM